MYEQMPWVGILILILIFLFMIESITTEIVFYLFLNFKEQKSIVKLLFLLPKSKSYF